MKIFNNIDPNTIESDPRVILKFTEYDEELKRDTFYYLLKDDDYLLWAIKSLFPSINGEPARWSGGTQLEIPKLGLPWFTDVIEQKFMKIEAEGGLPKGKFTHEEVIEGDRLCVARMFGTSGYGFRNYSRYSYLWEDEKDPQQADFSDELLFQKGLFDQLKVIADKIVRGEL